MLSGLMSLRYNSITAYCPPVPTDWPEKGRFAMYDPEEKDRLKRIEEKLNRLERQNQRFGATHGHNMYGYGYEYKSKKMVFGIPLVHLAYGFNPETGRMRVAKGFFAAGNIAIGVFAFGGIAFGGVAFGGVSIALAAIGGVALGILMGLGGMATGCIAFGGMAIGYYAVGGMAVGVHALGGNTQDPALLEKLRHYLPGIGKMKRY
jgi:hypothetical protein